jgi:hypothetical protein
MRVPWLLLPAIVPIGACQPVTMAPPWSSGAAIHDPGTIAGSWREIRRDGRSVAQGYVLSISSFAQPTFAVRRGCVASGGVLHPLGGNLFRVERYESGFSTEGCGPWRAGPEVAPFDASRISLVRNGQSLIAEGGGHRVEFRRLPAPVI